MILYVIAALLAGILITLIDRQALPRAWAAMVRMVTARPVIVAAMWSGWLGAVSAFVLLVEFSAPFLSWRAGWTLLAVAAVTLPACAVAWLVAWFGPDRERYRAHGGGQ